MISCNITDFINDTLDTIFHFINDESIDINLRYSAYNFLKEVSDRVSS